MFHRDLLLILVVVCGCIVYSSCWLFGSNENCCSQVGGECFNKNSPYDKLPVPQCFLPVFTLYTKTNTGGVTIATNNIPSSFQNKDTHFIVHGWNDSPRSEDQWMNKMKAKLLAKDDYNVIFVDWSSHGDTGLLFYDKAAANSRVCGKAISDLFQALMNAGLSRSHSHCIGHSLGGHVCGYAGQYTKMAWISALDPAGPQFEDLPTDARLSIDDADFVDAIHTDGGGFSLLDYGSLVAMGHVDFYPNGGKRQEGCLNKKRTVRETGTDADIDKEELRLIRRLEGLLDKERPVRGNIGCSHGRSIWLYMNSIDNTCFKALSKCTNYNDITSSCTTCSGVCQVMGFNSINYSGRGMYYLKTSANSPYHLGC